MGVLADGSPLKTPTSSPSLRQIPEGLIMVVLKIILCVIIGKLIGGMTIFQRLEDIYGSL